MRPIAMIVLILGVVLLIAGVVVAVAIPAATTFEPKSTTLLDDEIITAEAPWTSNNAMIMSERVATVGGLFDPIGPNGWQYDYELYFGAIIFVELKEDVVHMTGEVEETQGFSFNLYVFNEVNFDLWELRQAAIPYYSAMSIISQEFAFDLTEDESTSLMYFVMEKTSALQSDLTVRVLADASWIDKVLFPSPPPYESGTTPFMIEETQNIVLAGNVIETSGVKFSFYILDFDNLNKWFQDQIFESWFEATDVSSTSFSIDLTVEQANIETFYFVVENPDLVDQDIVATVSAQLQWEERAVIAGAVAGIVLGGLIGGIGVILLIVGAVLAVVLKPKPPAQTEQP